MSEWLKLLEQLDANRGLVAIAAFLLLYQGAQLLIKSGDVRIQRETLFNGMVKQQGLDISALQTQIGGLTQSVADWKKQNDELAGDNRRLVTANRRLTEDKGDLSLRVGNLEDSRKSLESEVDELRIKLGLPPKYAVPGDATP